MPRLDQAVRDKLKEVSDPNELLKEMLTEYRSDKELQNDFSVTMSRA